ncbi:tyrosine-type recombinase/integrase [Nocardia sp. NPDC059091]|uniref:tyrosine-type recombinase/integrase n=1 Tax=Nocardia sp. NPDC059091 TaxID=3346724 RepID=UPI0036BA9DFD
MAKGVDCSGFGVWAESVPAGTPFLISPRFEYDLALNEFFRSPGMLGAAWNTQAGYARDLAAFLTFLWKSRQRRSWRDVVEADHLAYDYWRRRDPAGPMIDDSTWDREVAAQNRFFKWQVSAQELHVNPIPQRECRVPPATSGHRGYKGQSSGQTPATYSHGRGRDKVEWLPQKSYRIWRDVGMRGYTAEGIPDPRFRGRWAARNATFCDLAVRTGMRLSEQSALTVFDLPLDHGQGGYQRFWLPTKVAKGMSARWVYVPASVRADLRAYVEIDRAEVVEDARVAGRYHRVRRPMVVEDPDRPTIRQGCRKVRVEQLDPAQRRDLLIDGPEGLEPAAFWLSEFGTPIAVSTWKSLFGEANSRCEVKGVRLRAHAHMLRHTFAVITLEQLQRGHISALQEMTPQQRTHYVRIFGDPLDWVRRRLGHSSVVTTQIYLHALEELEMETRMALVPEGWDDPRSTPTDGFPDDVTPPVVS